MGNCLKGSQGQTEGAVELKKKKHSNYIMLIDFSVISNELTN